MNGMVELMAFDDALRQLPEDEFLNVACYTPPKPSTPTEAYTDFVTRMMTVYEDVNLLGDPAVVVVDVAIDRLVHLLKSNPVVANLMVAGITSASAYSMVREQDSLFRGALSLYGAESQVQTTYLWPCHRIGAMIKMMWPRPFAPEVKVYIEHTVACIYDLRDEYMRMCGGTFTKIVPFDYALFWSRAAYDYDFQSSNTLEPAAPWPSRFFKHDAALLLRWMNVANRSDPKLRYHQTLELAHGLRRASRAAAFFPVESRKALLQVLTHGLDDARKVRSQSQWKAFKLVTDRSVNAFRFEFGPWGRLRRHAHMIGIFYKWLLNFRMENLKPGAPGAIEAAASFKTGVKRQLEE